VQNYCFFLKCNLFGGIFLHFNDSIGSLLLDNEQEIVLFAFLCEDVFAVEQHVGTGWHVGVGDLFLVDAHATALSELAHLALAGEDGCNIGQE